MSPEDLENLSLEELQKRAKKQALEALGKYQPPYKYSRKRKRKVNMDTLDSIFQEIREERQAQDAKWGGPDHDDQHVPNDWIAFIGRHAGMASYGVTDSTFRKQMKRVAALAVAAIEAYDRQLDAATKPITWRKK